jgi:hypothetical protein
MTTTVKAKSRALFTKPAANPKLAKSLGFGVSTLVLHLAPADLAGRGTTCRFASPECREACLNTGGHGGIGAGTLDEIKSGTRTNTVQAARIRKTHDFLDDADAFIARLYKEIVRHADECYAVGIRPAVRLNGTSDIPWERVARDLFDNLPDVTFYDYTKYPLSKRPTANLPRNYSLTMSYSGHNTVDCVEALTNGRNVAVVFGVAKGQPLPATWNGFPVLDGDLHDARFLDPLGHVVGLRAKGRARKLHSAFIVR